MADSVVWRDVKGFSNYEISSDGVIRNKKRGSIISQSKRGDYCGVNLWKNNKIYRFSVHRLVATNFIENYENKPQVNHIDGNKENNCVSNLEWCTQSENNLHASHVLNRPFARGEKHGQAKLTDDDVKEIRARYATGEYLQKELAIEYSIAQQTISSIVNNKARV